jgi:hypothetical protein
MDDVAVRVIGFDRSTERYATEVAVPRHVWAEARRIAIVPATDPDFKGSYPLDEVQVRQMAGVVGVRLDRRLDWFLEANATSPAPPP